MSFRRTLASNIAAAAFALSAAQGAYAQAETPAPAPPLQDANVSTSAIEKDSYTEFNPYFHPGVLGGMGLLYAAFCLMAWRRGMKGNLPRLFAGAVIMYGIANHQRVDEQRERLPTETLIVVDESPSQSLGERAATTAAAHELLNKTLSTYKNVNVRLVRVGGEKDGVAADGTRIFGSIDEALSDVPRNRLGGVFILSDGQIHDQIAAHYTLGEGVPVHALISGKEGEYDRRVALEEAPHFGLVNKKQDIKFVVSDDGTAPGSAGKVSVSIHQDGKLMTTRMVTPGEIATVSVDIAHAGPNVIEIKTDAVSGETTAVNNRIVASIEGIHEKLSVLIVTGAPNPNTRMWRNLLKSDPDVDPVHLIIQRYPEQLDDTPREELALKPFPMNEVFAENLSKFNLIILDNYEQRYLLANSYLSNITKYVQDGGALLVASGPEYASSSSIYKTPLGAILPGEPSGQVTERAFVPRISERGQRHPVTRGLAGGNPPGAASQQPTWGNWFRSVDVLKSTGEAVMEGADKKPLLILSHQEKGRVAMLNSDNVWRWESALENNGPYSSLLLQTAHWLMKNPALEEESLKITQQQKELVIEQQTMADKSTPVTVHTPSGKKIEATPEASAPGIWRSRLPANEMGLYSVSQAGAYPRVAFINVGPANAREFVHTVSTPDILKPLVSRTGGMVARMTDQAGNMTVPKLQTILPGNKDAPMSGTDTMNIRMTEASILRGIERKQVIDNNWLAGLLLLSMAAAYIRQSDKNPFKRKPPAPGGPAL